jgi:hypothetical protein
VKVGVLSLEVRGFLKRVSWCGRCLLLVIRFDNRLVGIGRRSLLEGKSRLAPLRFKGKASW